MLVLVFYRIASWLYLIRIWWILALKSDIWWHNFTNFMTDCPTGWGRHIAPPPTNPTTDHGRIGGGGWPNCPSSPLGSASGGRYRAGTMAPQKFGGWVTKHWSCSSQTLNRWLEAAPPRDWREKIERPNYSLRHKPITTVRRWPGYISPRLR